MQWPKMRKGYVPTRKGCVPKWDAVSMLKYALSWVRLPILGYKLSRSWVDLEKWSVRLSQSWITWIATWVRVMGVESGGRGKRPPQSKNQRGTSPQKLWYFSIIFIDTYANFAFSNIFEINWAKSEDKLNFGGRWVWVPWIRPPPPPQTLAAAAGRQRWGHGHAVITKFCVGEDSDNQTHLPQNLFSPRISAT